MSLSHGQAKRESKQQCLLLKIEGQFSLELILQAKQQEMALDEVCKK
jgi:hypothetical protein